MSRPVYLNAEQVRSVLDWPLVMEAVEEALRAVVPPEADPQEDASPPLAAIQPVRSVTVVDESRILLTMPAFVSQHRLPSSALSTNTLTDTLACKLVTSFSSNEQRTTPLPNILGHILLFNTSTGQLQSILEATQITEWRTAAASLVATKYLYTGPLTTGGGLPLTVAIIGCGRQGQSHALGICTLFNVAQIRLWNRTRSKALRLAEELNALNDIKGETRDVNWVKVCESPQEALKDAGVICIATYSPDALIDYNMLANTTIPVHINGKKPFQHNNSIRMKACPVHSRPFSGGGRASTLRGGGTGYLRQS